MSNHGQLIERVRSRKGAGLRFGQGFWTADRYASSIVECVGPGVCKLYFGSNGGFDASRLIKDAGNKLTYAGDLLRIEKAATNADEIRKELGDGGELPAHSLMLIKHVLTTPKEDRDEDVLETKGAKPDLKMPLLWQHIHTLPIGKLFKVLEHNDQVLRMATVLLDINDLTSDAAKLVEADALRFSHGFRALKFTEMTKGFRVIEFEIMEESLVSVPSNTDAEVELFSRGALKSEAFKRHAKALDDMRSKVFKGASFGELKAAMERGQLAVTPASKTAAPATARRESCGCGGSCGGCEGSKAANVSNGDEVYATEIDASARAEVLGCDGCHEVAGGYSPCTSPEILQQYAPAAFDVPEPSGTASADASVKSYEVGATVKLGTGDEGVIALINAGPVYDVKLNGGETVKRLLASELTLVQGADNGAYGEMTSSAKPRSKSLTSRRQMIKAGGVYRKMFDPATERLEPCSTEVDWAARFIGCGVKDLSLLNTACGGIMRGGFLDAFERNLAGYKIAETRNMSNGVERPPNYEAVEISSQQRSTFLTNGFRFMSSPDGWKFAYRTEENWGTQYFVIYSEDREKGQALIDKAWEELDRNNPLKGEAFQLTGGFLKRNGLEWSEIFLDQKNESSLKRIVRIVNDKGADAANRGVILKGPPGTGKTLGSRVIMNQADATYIWVAAKDFYKAGSYGAFAYTFDLARKLAPSIILFEDIDNYITDYTVDLLKSEMDGLAVSSGVTTLLTTNFPEKLPAALIDRPGRFHDVLEFGLPSKEVRRRMLEKWAVGASMDAVCEMADQTDGLSGAHVFELAKFAQIIRDEDEIGMDEALIKALAKVNEQRELIDSHQLAGSRYGRRETVATTKEMDFLPDGQTVRKNLQTIKAGRTLSQRNMSRLQEVHDTLDDMYQMDLAPRAAKTLAKAAMATCKAMMDECDPEESNSEDSGKSASQMTAEDAFKLLLSSGDRALLKKVYDAAGLLLDVAAADAKAEAYRRMVGRAKK